MQNDLKNKQFPSIFNRVQMFIEADCAAEFNYHRNYKTFLHSAFEILSFAYNINLNIKNNWKSTSLRGNKKSKI